MMRFWKKAGPDQAYRDFSDKANVTWRKKDLYVFVVRYDGLTVAHGRGHLARAVLEGVAFGLRDGLDLMLAAGMPVPDEIRASGGGLASPLWRQILADVLGTEIAGVATTEGAAYGAALLAAPAAGLIGSVAEASDAFVRVSPQARPGPEAGPYAERHALYRELYPALAPLFPRM